MIIILIKHLLLTFKVKSPTWFAPLKEKLNRIEYLHFLGKFPMDTSSLSLHLERIKYSAFGWTLF